MAGSWLEVERFGGTATKSWSMPALTARSTVAAGVLVSHTHIARVSVADEPVTVVPAVVAPDVAAAAAPGATASAAPARPTATSSEPATRATVRRGRRVRGVRTM